MKVYVMGLIMLSSIVAYAQDETPVAVQTQKLQSDQQLELHRTGTKFSLILRDNNQQVVRNISLDTVAYSIGFGGTGRLIEDIGITFFNDQEGYVYGYEVGYAHYPFIQKTTDGGRTWKRVLFKQGETASPLKRDNFFMFDQNRGIAITNWNSNSQFNYHITNDGGKTWEPKNFIIKSENMHVLNSLQYLKCTFSEDGQVTAVITNPDFEHHRNDKIVIIKSNDAGKTFRILK